MSRGAVRVEGLPDVYNALIWAVRVETHLTQINVSGGRGRASRRLQSRVTASRRRLWKLTLDSRPRPTSCTHTRINVTPDHTNRHDRITPRTSNAHIVAPPTPPLQ